MKHFPALCLINKLFQHSFFHSHKIQRDGKDKQHCKDLIIDVCSLNNKVNVSD
jgi:hypothetical protein